MMALAGVFLVGAALGAVVQCTHFCTMGAIADFVLFGSTRRLRSWLLAVAVAMAGTQALLLLGLVDAASVAGYPARTGWLGIVVGGLAFGFGMVLAGGCLSRNLVRLAAGSLKSLLVVLLAGLLAAAVWTGVLAAPASVLATVAPGHPPPAGAAWVVPGLVAAAVLAAGALADTGFRNSPRELLAGLLLGLLPPMTWLLVAVQPEAAMEGGLSFAIPTALALAGAMTPVPAAFPLALVLGTLLGAFATAGLTGQLRIETFSTADDMRRHVVGGALMGIGGGLAAGCTVGHGITGLAALAPASLLAVCAMTAGAVWALGWLQTGSLLPRTAFRNDA